ncbi:hypothetical protein KAH94_03345 [bacterium]|nr:hypothetical protein [bacterium]
MNIKKTVLSVMCSILIFSASMTRAEDTEENDLCAACGVIVGFFVIAAGAFDLNNIIHETFSDGQRSQNQFEPYLKTQPTVGGIKIAIGSAMMTLGVKYLLDKIYGHKNKKKLPNKRHNSKL